MTDTGEPRDSSRERDRLDMSERTRASDATDSDRLTQVIR